MSFLTLNGLEIPTLKGGEIEPIIIGEKGRAFTGTLLNDRRAIKRKWRFETKELSNVDATTLENLLLGRGDSWTYDSSLYSGKGLSPGGTLGTIRPGVAADGSVIYNFDTGEPESKFGAGALTVQDGAINILPADSRDAENAPTGYSAVSGATLAADTTHYVHGAKGVEVTAGAADRGVQTLITPTSAVADYVGSVYIYSAAPGSVKVELYESGFVPSDKIVSLAGGQWTRVEVSVTATGVAGLHIRIKSVGGALTFTCDNFQIELGTVATSWVDGTRAAEELLYPSIFTGYDLTVAMWARGPVAHPPSNAYLFSGLLLGGPFTNQMRAYRLNGTGSLRIRQYDEDGDSDLLTVADVFDGDWHHIAVTVKAARGATPYITRVYVDGVEAASGAVKPIEPPLWTGFYIGNNGGNQWTGLIDELVVAPFSASASLIAAWASRTSGLPALPKILAEGDCVDTFGGVEVEGTIGVSTFQGITLDGTYANTARRVRFELES